MENNKKSGITRRNFLVNGAVATAVISGFPFVYTTRAQQRVKPIRIAVNGCGGRGTGAVQNAIDAAPDVHLIAMADPFMDRIESSYKNLTTPRSQRGEAPQTPPRPPGHPV